MSKKDTLAAIAERMYVIDQMTLNEIASQLKIHEKSVRNWKEEFEWAKKRAQYIKTNTMFHEELFGFARKLMSSIQYDMEQGERVDPGRMFTFAKVLPLITKIKEYEDNVAKKGLENKENLEITPDFIKLINEEFLGIKQDGV